MITEVLIVAASIVVLVAFWLAVVIVIPGAFAIWLSSLLPLTGQWRTRWRERRQAP